MPRQIKKVHPGFKAALLRNKSANAELRARRLEAKFPELAKINRKRSNRYFRRAKRIRVPY